MSIENSIKKLLKSVSAAGPIITPPNTRYEYDVNIPACVSSVADPTVQPYRPFTNLQTNQMYCCAGHTLRMQKTQPIAARPCQG